MKVVLEKKPIRVKGFRFAGVRAGLKESGRKDVAVLFSESPAVAAAAFTTNVVKAAPVLVGLERAAGPRLQAIVVNSGNANAFTGVEGVRHARAMCRAAARELKIPEKLVIPSSTGRIGVPLPMKRVEAGIRAACAALSPDGFHDALEGIMTTDAFPKFAVETTRLGGKEVTIAGMTKGAGMIAPQMRMVPHATNLTYVCTDAAVSVVALRKALSLSLPRSFNAIVVDGDMSTNDTAVLLANGAAGNPEISARSREFPIFAERVAALMARLARMIVKDGEGATKVVEVCVTGARNAAEARRAADTLARSPLCKTAFYGGDPYMGRVLCALGYSGARFDPGRVEIHLNEVRVVRGGRELVGAVEDRAAAVTRLDEFTLTVNLHCGKGSSYRLVSDLTVDYVKFNSDYRT